MNVETIGNITAIEITEVPHLDPILVIFQDFTPGVGRVIIHCYGQAWAAFWGGMSGKTVREFVAGCDSSYIVNNLRHHDLPVKAKKSEGDYLERIVNAILVAIKPKRNFVGVGELERTGYIDPSPQA